MRLLAFVIASVALLGLMACTNPSPDDFGNYVRQSVIRESEKEAKNPLGRFWGSVVGGIAGGLVSTQAVRTDCIFFSIYDLRLGDEQIKALGVFRNFVLLKKPDFKRYKIQDSPAR
jgi:hypothetical protein